MGMTLNSPVLILEIHLELKFNDAMMKSNKY